MPKKKIEGFDSSFDPNAEIPKTVKVEGLDIELPHPMFSKKEEVKEVEAVSAEKLAFDDPIIDESALKSLPSIPEPTPIKHTIKQSIPSQTLPPAKDPNFHDWNPQVDEWEGKVITNPQDYNFAHGMAKMNGRPYIEVSQKLFDYMMRGQKGDYFIHDSVKVYKEGTREAIEKRENRIIGIS